MNKKINFIKALPLFLSPVWYDLQIFIYQGTWKLPGFILDGIS